MSRGKPKQWAIGGPRRGGPSTSNSLGYPETHQVENSKNEETPDRYGEPGGQEGAEVKFGS